uniref:Aminodeoxyfutalosine nucleosidase n=1 Tax=Talaromyces marneffei PM1 TaxID=1077442 RepID=A0A093VH40_TALMA
MTTKPQTRGDFHVGIVCTLDIEKQAIDKFFDEVYNAADYGKLGGDANYYKIGRIGRHNVVLVKLSGKGTQYSARSVTDLSQSYPGIKVYLLVGICAGVPFRGRDRTQDSETILGDVIIGDSIVQTDYGKQYSEEYQRRTDRREVLGNPPLDIRNMLSHLKSEPEPLLDKMMSNLQLIQSQDQGRWNYKGVSEDRLFDTPFRHRHYTRDIICECINCKTKDDPICHTALRDSCTVTGCADNYHCLISRIRLATVTQSGHLAPQPSIHFGTIASTNAVLKSGEHRDQLVQKERVQEEEEIIAFEMEGAGMWDSRPCVIIKGVSDYADSHKNDIWHAYAAATAASCTKAFLDLWIPSDPLPTAPPLRERRSLQVLDFIKEFDQTAGPSHAIIQEYWNKVIPQAYRKPNALLPLSQGLVLAVLYMLHVFHTLHEHPPFEFDTRRHAYLSRFADWAPCCCPLNCRRAWNFVSYNGIWRRMSDRESDGLHGRCLVDMHLNHNFRDTEYVTAYKTTWDNWWNAYSRHRRK